MDDEKGFWDLFLQAGIWLLFVVLLVPAGVVGYVIGRHEAGGGKPSAAAPSPPRINAAPAFTAADLAALPTDNWITNGGSLANERYSPLTQISTSNVAQLKGVWLTHLRGSATAPKYSAEGQPLVWDGVIYAPTGQDDVFAISADTGQIIWQYQAHLDQTISTVCCGWISRGVALGDGKVYIGQLDGKLVALDQKTGNVAWTTQVARWQDGYSITNAPLYYDGRVITGVSGGEFEIRGRVTAFDARTGKEVWRFYTVPGPGETGHETWPQTGNAWQHGSAPVWQTPSVDPKLGLLYFTTGNAGPDNDGSRRAGKNLFTASMIALDPKTGKLKWYYQMVHQDIWDYDAPSPTILFDATIGGRLAHGIGEAEKTGWLYLLDRETGKPLFPTPEKPVPQLAVQKTWPTQPFPSYAPVVPQMPSQQQYLEVLKIARKTLGHRVKAIKAKAMFTPYWHMFCVCAQSGVTGDTAETKKPAKQKPGGVKQTTLGSVLTLGGGFGQNVGTFSAIDATTGRIVWQKRWPESCYAGSATTAGNVVFIGRSGGQLQAYDARTGLQLWSFQTGTGANDAPTIFQRHGKEYLVFYAGGNALAASPHGDNLWLLGLDGKLGPAPPPGAGAGIGHAGEAGGPPAQAGNPAAGKSVFANNCASCHGADGHGGNGGPDLTSIPSAKNLQVVIGQVENGGPGMPAFKGTLTQKQIDDVAAHVVKNITHGK